MNDQQQAIRELRQIIMIEDSGPRRRDFETWYSKWIIKFGLRHDTPKKLLAAFPDALRYEKERARRELLEALAKHIEIVELEPIEETYRLSGEVLWIGRVTG